MEFLQYYNQSKFFGFVSKIKQDMASWQIVEVELTGKTSHNASYISKKLKDYFGDRDGLILMCGNKDILVLVNMGKEASAQSLVSGINDKMPKHSCRAEATTVSAEGILKFQLKLQDIEDVKKENPLLAARRGRAEKNVLVVDDDMFIRAVLKKTLEPKARILELEDADQVVETYLAVLPDAVFIDIHLPGGSGMDLIEEILTFDDSAYLIVMSGDSVKDHVLNAKKLGAKGFLSKPLLPDKLVACFKKCPTVT